MAECHYYGHSWHWQNVYNKGFSISSFAGTGQIILPVGQFRNKLRVKLNWNLHAYEAGTT